MKPNSTKKGRNKIFPRREFIKDVSMTVGTLFASTSIFSGCRIGENIAANPLQTEVLDEALKMMTDVAPLGNHGPMAAEALVSLERGDKLFSFVADFKKRFSSSFPPKYQNITPENWKEAIGEGNRMTDWIAFFEEELKEEDWKRVLNKWSDILAPGLSAAAAHGLIRTGHAARSLNRKVTIERRNELAQALSYWASYYQVLPESKEGNNLKLGLTEAIQKIPILPPEKFVNGRGIIQELKNLDDFPPFANITNFIEIKGASDKLISALTEVFAKVYLEKVNRRTLIRLLHIITGLSAIRTLVPYLSKPTTKRMLYYGWQAAAGLYSISGDDTHNEIEDLKLNPEDLIERAVNSNEVHAIKFTDAALREYKLNPKPIYLKAAKDVLERLT